MESERIEEGLAEWIAALRGTPCFVDDVDAEKTLVAVFEGLGEVLAEDERRAITRHVPTALGDAMEGGGRSSSTRTEVELIRGIASKRGTSLSDTKERLTTVCDLVTERLPDDVRAKLIADLPPWLSQRFVLRRPRCVRYAHPLPHPPSHGDTLSSGRPGSEHPISEAHPSRGPRGPNLD